MIILILAIPTTAFAFYLIGEYMGRKKDRALHLASIRETISELYCAQKEAGVTEEQFAKINLIIGKQLIKEGIDLLKEKCENFNSKV